MDGQAINRRQLLEAAAAATILGPGFAAFAGDRQQREASLRLDTREAFDAYGTVRLPGAVSHDIVAEMRHQLYDLLDKHHGIRHDDPRTWSPDRKGVIECQGALRLVGVKAISRKLPKSEPFERLVTATSDAIDSLFGTGTWQVGPRWCGPSINFPGRSDDSAMSVDNQWTVPRSNWYGGGIVEPQQTLPWMMTCTVLLERSEPGGGGPLTIPGSHRLVRRAAETFPAIPESWRASLGKVNSTIEPQRTKFVKSRKVKRLLASRVPWFNQLFDHWGREEERIVRFMREGCLHDEVPLKVVEATGEPGDMILHTSCGLSGLSANISGRPHVGMAMTCMRA